MTGINPKRIAHLCLSCFYIDGCMYQENALVRQHKIDGHDVTVIASTETFGGDKKLTYLNPGSYTGSDGAQVIRLPYRKGPRNIMAKLRFYVGLMDALEMISPDIIICHGISGGWLKDIVRYKNAHPMVRIFADNHADFNNSGTNFLSMQVLHRWYYRGILRRVSWVFEKILCISLETLEFANQVYDLPTSTLEFFPLGGVVFSDAEYMQRRERGRSLLCVDGDAIVFLQSGKFDAKKKLIEACTAFSRQTTDKRFRFIVVGHMDGVIKSEFKDLVAGDSRISFVGWQSADVLMDLLCAADMYVQPGSQSATMQMSLSARCPIILADVKAHRPYYNGNGWLVTNDAEIHEAMAAIQRNPSVLQEMSARSLDVAKRLLDYKMLAARFY